MTGAVFSPASDGRMPGVLELGARTVGAITEVRTAEEVSTPYGDVLRVRATAQGGPAVVSDLATLELTLPSASWTAHWFDSDWGDEFTPRAAPLTGPLHLGVLTGRSSKGQHPWVALESDLGCLVVAPAWSGNWRINVVPQASGLVVRAGISGVGFSREVTPERDFVAPDVWAVWGTDRLSASSALARAAWQNIVPRTQWTDRIAVEWNHWWPYEDAEIDHAVFVRDAALARDLGAEVATCDAGWFGRADAGTFWERERGDWDSENLARFPTGVAGLADDVRRLGLEFGVWIEAEAVGVDARVRVDHPEFMARRDESPSDSPLDVEDPGFLGYVCLGSPAAREHLRDVLDRLLQRTGARWLKWDFNLDPGTGCTRTDHGHAAGDGLYEHYLGVYALMDHVRRAHPDVLLEACSSGGLRIDLGLAGHVHCAFLSDPDWTEFHLQLLWGASAMLPASAILHFPESQWRTFHPLQNFDPQSADAPLIDSMLRSVMLHRYGLSYRLDPMPGWMRERIAVHNAMHARYAAPLIRSGGIIRPLTDQPLREGRGHRFPAFELHTDQRSLITVHALSGASEQQRVLPTVDVHADYRLELLGPDADPADLGWSAGDIVLPGAAVAEAGLTVSPRGPASSWCIALHRMEGSP